MEMMNLCSECPRFDFVEDCNCDCNNELYHYEQACRGDGELLRSYNIICDKCEHVYGFDEREYGDER